MADSNDDLSQGTDPSADDIITPIAPSEPEPSTIEPGPDQFPSGPDLSETDQSAPEFTAEAPIDELRASPNQLTTEPNFGAPTYVTTENPAPLPGAHPGISAPVGGWVDAPDMGDAFPGPTYPGPTPKIPFNPLHIVLPIVLMVVALAGIITPLVAAHATAASNPGRMVPGSGQSGFPGGRRTMFPSGYPSNMPSNFPSGRPTVMPTGMPTVMPSGFTPGQRGTYYQNGRSGQGGPQRTVTASTSLTAGQIGVVSASSVVFLAAAAYLVVALLRRRSITRRPAA